MRPKQAGYEVVDPELGGLSHNVPCAGPSVGQSRGH